MVLQLISETTAKLADNAGFDYETDYFYCPEYEEGKLLDYDYGITTNIDKNGYKTFSVCTQAELQKWLREEKGIAVDVYTDLSNTGFQYHCDMIALFDLENYTASYHLRGCFKTYEEALEAGMQKALSYL